MKKWTVWLSFLAIGLFGAQMALAAQEPDPDRDPFYTKGVAIEEGPPINGLKEYFDPFAGHLKLAQTEFELPQNGGLELKLMRYYDSAIWSRRETWVTPGIVAFNENSPLGVGWKMHMGIVKNPGGTGLMDESPSSVNYRKANYPVVIMPDGSEHPLFQDPTNTSQLRTKEFWTYKKIQSQNISLNLPALWELTLADGTVYTFSSGADVTHGGYSTGLGVQVAQAVKIQNPSRDYAIEIHYKKQLNDWPRHSHIDYIYDSCGRTIWFYYDLTVVGLGSTNQLTMIEYEGKRYTYTYDLFSGTNILPGSYLREVKPPLGNSWKYDYEETVATPNGLRSRYQLTKLQFPTGGLIEYTYKDQLFRVGRGPNVYKSDQVLFRVLNTRKTSGSNANGTLPVGTTTYSYEPTSPTGARTTILAPNGRKEVHTYNGWGNSTAGTVWKVGTPSNVDIYQDNALIEARSYTWGVGTKISTTGQCSGKWYPLFAADLACDADIYVPFLQTEVVARGGATHTKSYSLYNTYGDPGTIVETGDKSRTTSLTYFTDTTRNLVKNFPAQVTVSSTGQTGTSITKYTYDNAATTNRTGAITKIDRDGVITNFAYYPSAIGGVNGNLKSITDANSKATSFTWSNGRIATITNPVYATVRTVNPNGTIASEKDGRNYTTSYLYDALFRLTKITPPAGNVTTISYPVDQSSRLVQRGSAWTKDLFDGYARPVGTIDSKGVQTGVVYLANGLKDAITSNIGDTVYFDAFERPEQVIHRDNSYLYYTYNGSDVLVTDEENYPTTYDYVAYGHPDDKLLIGVTDQDFNLTSYEYNIAGGLTKITQGTQIRSYAYNTKYFLTSETNPETGAITYTRDSVGNLKTVTDATGTTTYYYDGINRLDYFTKSGKTIDYTYDKADNRTGLVSPDATLTFTYDAANRPTGKTELIGGATYAMVFEYDGNDNLRYLTYPSTRKIEYLYNSNDQVTSVKDVASGAIYASLVQYNLAGLPSAFRTGNNLDTALTYNSRNLLDSLTVGTVVNRSHTYWPRGNTKTISNALNAAKNQSFGYDKLNRLTSFSGAWGSGAMTYDRFGNRKSKSVGANSSTYNYSATTYRLDTLTGADPASFFYNGVGQMSSSTWSGTGYVFEYDNFSRLSKITAPPYTLGQYTYDGDGLRVTKASDGKVSVYHNGPDGNVLAENYSDQTQVKDFVYLNDKLLAKVEGGQATYYHTDQVGTPLAITNQSGVKVWEADYLPFGEIHSELTTVANDRKFVGKERDEESNLDYFGARYHYAKIGRFLAPDPVRAVDGKTGKIVNSLLQNPQRANVYAYSLNNPYRYVDEDGNYGIDIHYNLTKHLAMKAGLWRTQAIAIANANQHVDDNTETSPMPSLIGGLAIEARKLYHFPTASRVDELMSIAFKSCNEKDLGRALHAYQDSFSHEGYEPVLGHLFSGKDPDNVQLQKNWGNLVEMSKGTTEVLNRYKNECNCENK